MVIMSKAKDKQQPAKHWINTREGKISQQKNSSMYIVHWLLKEERSASKFLHHPTAYGCSDN